MLSCLLVYFLVVERRGLVVSFCFEIPWMTNPAFVRDVKAPRKWSKKSGCQLGSLLLADEKPKSSQILFLLVKSLVKARFTRCDPIFHHNVGCRRLALAVFWLRGAVEAALNIKLAKFLISSTSCIQTAPTANKWILRSSETRPTKFEFQLMEGFPAMWGTDRVIKGDTRMPSYCFYYHILHVNAFIFLIFY